MALNFFSVCLLLVALLGGLGQAKRQPPKPPTPEYPQKPQYPVRPGFRQPSIPKTTCEVAQPNKIQCGPPDITQSECESIYCCYDGQMCFYRKTVTVTVAPVALAWHLGVGLLLANGQCITKGCDQEDVAYSSFYQDSDYPVIKALRDPVYVDVRLWGSSDPHLVLTLGRCWATSNADPSSLPQWDLLVDGCPFRDDRYRTTLVPVGVQSGLDFPTHHRRFVFKMFTFVSTGSASPTNKNPKDANSTRLKVYIHCSTKLCQPSAQNNCEPKCYRSRRDVSALVKSGQDSITVSSSQIIFVDSSSDAQ